MNSLLAHQSIRSRGARLAGLVSGCATLVCDSRSSDGTSTARRKARCKTPRFVARLKQSRLGPPLSWARHTYAPRPGIVPARSSVAVGRRSGPLGMFARRTRSGLTATRPHPHAATLGDVGRRGAGPYDACSSVAWTLRLDQSCCLARSRRLTLGLQPAHRAAGACSACSSAPGAC